MVPIRATPTRMNADDRRKCGMKVLDTTACQFGWPSTMAIGYVMKTRDRRRKTRSA